MKWLKHGDERRSYIDPMPLSMDREDLIEERAIAITLSEDNYIDICQLRHLEYKIEAVKA